MLSINKSSCFQRSRWKVGPQCLLYQAWGRGPHAGQSWFCWECRTKAWLHTRLPLGPLDLPGPCPGRGLSFSLGQVLTGGEIPTKQGESEGRAEPASLLPGVHWHSAPGCYVPGPSPTGEDVTLATLATKPPVLRETRLVLLRIFYL